MSNKNRLYFLQDLKAVLEKHDALLEVESDCGDVNFMYDLNGFDYPEDRQTGNELGGTGEYGVFELNQLIEKELNDLQ